MMTSTSASDLAALSVAGFAERLGIGLSTAKSLVAAGEIKSFRIGRRVLVPQDEIAGFISRRMAAAEAESTR